MAKILGNPGHDPKWGSDPGAVNNRLGIQENTSCLAIGKILRELAKQQGHEFYLLQHTSPSYIANFANEWGADYFLSIHCNAYTDPSANGTETWFCPGSVKGREMAEIMQSELLQEFKLKDRGIKSNQSPWPKGIPILRQTYAPAILVETAFITNDNEARLIADYPERWAQAMLRAINKF